MLNTCRVLYACRRHSFVTMSGTPLCWNRARADRFSGQDFNWIRTWRGRQWHLTTRLVDRKGLILSLPNAIVSKATHCSRRVPQNLRLHWPLKWYRVRSVSRRALRTTFPRQPEVQTHVRKHRRDTAGYQRIYAEGGGVQVASLYFLLDQIWASELIQDFSPRQHSVACYLRARRVADNDRRLHFLAGISLDWGSSSATIALRLRNCPTIVSHFRCTMIFVGQT